jgi:hypothetical protein
MTVTWIVLRWATLAKGEGGVSMAERLDVVSGWEGSSRAAEERRVSLLLFLQQTRCLQLVGDAGCNSTDLDYGIPRPPPWKRHPAKRRLPAVFRRRSSKLPG